tara:strand:- start:2451 stop:2651 length:201 start_codon:yes stop_codon:yes gene_type:complete
MKIITHKFRRKDNDIVYLVNLIDVTGHPLESLIAENKGECIILANTLALENGVKNVLHNPGFSIIV